jgi:hypothetical protein
MTGASAVKMDFPWHEAGMRAVVPGGQIGKVADLSRSPPKPLPIYCGHD